MLDLEVLYVDALRRPDDWLEMFATPSSSVLVPPNGHRSTRRRMYWQMYWHVCSRPVQGQFGPGADLCHGETSCSRHCKRGAGPVALTSLAARESPARPREPGFALASHGLEVRLLGLATARHRGIRERVLRTGAAASATGESSEAAAANTES